MGFLPEKVQMVLKALPVLHGSAMLREIFTKKAMETTFQGLPGEVAEEYKAYMGITVKAGEKVLGSEIEMAFLLGFAIIMVIASVIAWKAVDRSRKSL